MKVKLLCLCKGYLVILVLLIIRISYLHFVIVASSL